MYADESPSTVQQTPYRNARQYVVDRIDRLEHLLSGLEQQLEPALTPVLPETTPAPGYAMPSDPGPVADPRSRVVSELETTARTLDQLGDRLSELLARLEL